MPMNPMQMQLIQQQMMGGFDGFEDDIYDWMDPQLFYMLGYGNGLNDGFGFGHGSGFNEAAQYCLMGQMAQQMQMMPYHGRGLRNPRRRARRQMEKMLYGGMGVGFGAGIGMGGYAGRAVMGSPYGYGGGRANQLMLNGASPWGGRLLGA